MRKKSPGTQITGSPWPPRCRNVLLLTIYVCTSIALGSASAQEPSKPALEQATVYPEDYSDPPADLRLSETGAKRSERLGLYYKAIWLREQGYYDKALGAFESLLEVDTRNSQLAADTATMCASLKQFDRAVKILEDNLARNPGKLAPYLNLSNHCAVFHNDEEEIKKKSVQYGEQALEKFPASREVYPHMVRLHLAGADKASAAKVIHRTADLEVDDPAYWLQIGTVAQEVWPLNTPKEIEQNREHLTPIYEKALAAAAGNESVVEKVADYYAKSRQWDRAIAMYTDIIEKRPDYLEAREKLAGVYGVIGREDERLATLQALLEVDPNSARVHESLAKIHEERKDTKDVIKHRSEALRLGEDKYKAPDYVKLARLMLSEEMTKEALDLLKRGRVQFPESLDLAFFLAITHGELDQHKEAIEIMAEVEKGNEGELLHGFYFNWGAMADQAGDHDKAAELFRKSIDKVPKEMPEEAAQAYNYLGYMWLNLGKNIDEAGELIKQALQLKPDTGAYQDSLGWYQFLKGKYDEALETLLSAEKNIETPDPEVFDHIAQTYEKLAIRYLEKAVELDGATDEMKERLAKLKSAK